MNKYINISRLNKLSQLLTKITNKKHIIILNPERISRIMTSKESENIDINVNIDVDSWILPDDMKQFIDDINKNPSLSIEEKILKIYEKLCTDYMYDDNVLSYIKRYDEDQFGLPDFYGRATDEEWKKKRAQHNRRNCFEISRILVKSIDSMLDGTNSNNSFETCILWDEALAHYFVGVISKDYCLTLDLDDFNEIKDLTRVKTELTIKGIRILSDPNDKFKKVLDKFNFGKNNSSIEHIQELAKSNNDDLKTEEISSDDLKFIQYTLEILINKYKLDSAGIFEYMKEIIDTKIGPSSRKKVWTEVKTTTGDGKRYTRCLVVDIGKQSYIIDVTDDSPEHMLRPIDKSEISTDSQKGKYFKFLDRDWEDKYDGR